MFGDAVITMLAGTRAGQDRRWLLITAAAATAFVLAVFWPGFMTVDSNQQLLQARSGLVLDLQPPVMAWVWRLSDIIWAGPTGMVLLHNLVFWVGALLIVQRALQGRAARTLAAVLLLVYPPVIALLGTVWKDIGMGGSLALAVGLLATEARTRRGRIARAIGIATAVVYACTVRHNGIAAVVPLVVAVVYAQWAGQPRRWIPACVIVVGSVCGLTAALNYAALTGPHQYATQLILNHDLVAMSLEGESLLLPAHLNQGPWTFENVAPHYTPEGAQGLFSKYPGALPITDDAVEYAAIVTAWRQAIGLHPYTYAAHRWAVLHAILFGRADGSACYPFATGVRWDAAVGIANAPTALHGLVAPVLTALANTLLFRPWVHAVLALGLLIAAMRRRRLLAGAVAASGLLYVAAYLVAGTTCDFRMAWWLVLAVPFATLLLFAPLRGGVEDGILVALPLVRPLALAKSPRLGH